jgi:hypothetical protein
MIAYAGQLGMYQQKFAPLCKTTATRARGGGCFRWLPARHSRGPVIFVNAKRIDGVPSLKTLTEYVEAELAAKK